MSGASSAGGLFSPMKQAVLKIIDKTARRASQSMALARKYGESFDVLEVACLKAAYELAEFYEQHLITARPYNTAFDLLSRAIVVAPKSGLFLEFGVASGRTISHIANQLETTIYGFDSFEGLPETWRSGIYKGAFAGPLPPVPPNAHLIKGSFDQTLPEFLKSHPENVSLLHVDCVLYSSTKTILDLLAPRVVSGSVVVFDEYWNYPGWQRHEHLAFQEFITSNHIACEPIGFVPSHQQVGFVITNSDAEKLRTTAISA